LRVIISSRVDPPLALSRLRVRGQLVEIRMDDLRFTIDEVEALLRDVARLNVTPADAALLASRTDGWAAGLHLATISAQEHGTVHQLAQEFDGNHRYVADYLVEEVLSRQPEHIQEFLLRTSVLERFTASLCDAVAGATDGAEFLRYLERNNLFTVAMDDERHWYRYHALFAELLQRRLEILHPGLCDILLARASDWFRAQGIGAEAVEYALRAGDYERAATILDDDDVALQALDRGELETVLRWLAAIGEDARYRHPKLNGVTVWSLLSTGRIDEVEPYIDAMQRFADEPGQSDDARDVVHGIVAAGRTALAVHHRDFEATIALSDKALALLPEDYPIARANTLYSRGFALGLTGNSGAAVETFRAAAAALGPDGSAPFLMTTHTALAQSLLHQAELHEAERVLRGLLELVYERNLGAWPYVGFIRICLARVMYERGELHEALAEAEAGVALAVRWITTGFQIEGHFTLASILLAMGDEEGALERLEPARALVPRSSPNPLLGRLDALGHRAGTRSDLEESAAWAERQLASLPNRRDALWPWLAVYRLAIRILTDCGRIAEARQAAGLLVAAAEQYGWVLYALQMRAALARCLWLDGDRAGAVDALTPTFAVAEAEHLVQLHPDAGPEVRDVVAEAASGPAATLWLQELANVFHELREPLVAARRNGDHPELSEALSERELEVLEQISLGKSNNEIADSLFLAVGTIKRHTHNIYGKLGVQSRTQAVAQARRLGLLDDL
jgi:LuxR family maltose regulon positive regulatory protein